jgi:asparagine synthase (glutamine-hydrolysing)
MKPDGYCARIGGSAAPRGIAPPGPEEGGVTVQTMIGNAAVMTGRRCGTLHLPTDAGLVLGTLFDRSGKRVGRVSPETVASWIATSGKALIERYWGAYLAILSTPQGTLLVRDPSGLFPCYYRHSAGGILAASDLAWFDATGVQARGICWPEIHAQLQYSSLRTRRTAIADVYELLPGETLQVQAEGIVVEQLWTPYAFATGHAPPLTFEEAADRLRRVADLTIGAWARLFARPLVEISGGLDSSIVAAIAARVAPGIEAVTWRGGDADLDESGYARILAGHLGIPLHRVALDSAMVDLHRSAAGYLPRPSGRSFAQANDRQGLQLARQLGSDAFLVGAGGDTILWYFNTAAPALDRLRIEGVAGFLRTVGDLAQMCGVPWSQSLLVALRKRLQRRPLPWPANTGFLSADAQPPAAEGEHPWWPPPPDTLPGTRAYVRALIQLSDHHEYHERATHAPVIPALVSQPIVEACLAMPSWLSCTGGANRAVARAAYANALPEAIVARRSKGGFDGFVHDLLERNRTTAREMLLDGTLAREGWLDREAILAVLQDPAPIAPHASLRLLRLVAVEAWLNSVRR